LPRPTLHILAGPNGAGKTTLYETKVKAFTTDAEFVNADLLALKHFGHLATTVHESAIGRSTPRGAHVGPA
jgi:predicted ABC-type ATPase